MQNGWETGKKQGQPLSGIALIPYYIYRTFASFAPHALKGQKLLAQGIALGYLRALAYRPVRAKALKLQAKHKAFALTGRLADCHYTQGDALG